MPSNGNSNNNNNNNNESASDCAREREFQERAAKENVEELVERKQFRAKVAEQLGSVQQTVGAMQAKLAQAIVLKSDEDSGLSPLQLLQSIQRIVAENERATGELERKAALVEQLRAKVAHLHAQNEAFIDQKNELLEQRNASLNTASEQARRQLAALEAEKAALAAS